MAVATASARPVHQRGGGRHRSGSDYICLGLATMDYTWTIPQIPATPTKVLATDFAPGGGGMAATAAVTMARLGASVAFWGRAGDDAAGRLMREELSLACVNVEQFRLFQQGRSPVAAVLVDPSGERLISTFRGEHLPEDPEWLPLSCLHGAQAVLADMRWLAGAITLFSHARALGVPTVLDADIADAADFPGVLALTDHAIFSAAGLQAYAPTRTREEALTEVRQHGCRVAGVTNGQHGTLWQDASGLKLTPAYPVAAVDTTGAGDVFHGAYAVAIGRGQPTEAAMRFASAAAALKCRCRGARDGIPTLHELNQFVRRVQLPD